MRTFNIISRFYLGGVFLFNFLVTWSCIYLLNLYGSHAYQIIGILFWYKVITIGVMFSTALYYQKNVLYYYQSLGISKLRLGIVTSITDFLLWVGLVWLQLITGIPGSVFSVMLWIVLLTYLYSYLKK